MEWGCSEALGRGGWGLWRGTEYGMQWAALEGVAYGRQWAVLSCREALGRRRGAVGSGDNDTIEKRPIIPTTQGRRSGGFGGEWRRGQRSGLGPWAVEGQ